MDPEKTIEKPKGNQPVAEFQGDMLEATKPLTDAIPEIGSLFTDAFFAPVAFFF